MKLSDFSLRKERATVVREELLKLFPGKQSSPLDYTTDFELLVAVILSAQMTDKKVNEITPALFKRYPDIRSYAESALKELERYVYSTGFYKAKARYLKNSAKMILEKFDGVTPDNLKDLLTLPGVGRKTALVVLGHLHNRIDGIAVDTHVIRLANKFGLVYSKDPLVIERELCKLFDKEDWWDVSYRLKAYGRTYSPARPKKEDHISLVLKRKGLL